jgi:hypothetical protein
VNGSLLYETNEFVLQLFIFTLLLATTELGFHIGRRFEADTPERTKPHISTVEAALLGVLGLLMGFTVAMAVSRFEMRKQLVLDEANALGTCLLRTQLLTPPHGTEIYGLLHQYIDVRVRYGNAGTDAARLDTLRAEGATLQNKIWSLTATYAQQDPNPVKSGLLLQSLNQAFDLEASRWATYQDHVPETVIYVDAIVGLLAIMLVGYTFGLNGRRQLFSMSVLALSITLVLSVIIDLDRSRSGFIRVSQKPVMDLQHRP